MTKSAGSTDSSSAIRTTPSTPGARESNAGDAFHVLWAARQALRLLEPHAGLQRVMMEGVTPADGIEGDDDDLFLGVDLSEYFGGTDFGSAERVIASQLKYSTRHPRRAWTASRLSTGRKNETSVIRRLADIYKGFLQHGVFCLNPQKGKLEQLSSQISPKHVSQKVNFARLVVPRSQNMSQKSILTGC